jgi:NAD+ kinase
VIGRVAIVVHTGKPEAVEYESKIADWLADRSIEVTEKEPDLVLSLGGDGTMLRAAQIAHRSDALLVGVNFGSLSYLTEVESDDLGGALERILAGELDIESRMMLQCRSDDRDDAAVALNEVLVERSSRTRLVRLGVSIGGERLADFNADGLIVATPTGSTAYALSAGGPIVSPRAQCIILVPVSAHMVFARPFVLAPDVEVEIEVGPGRDAAALAIDGGVDREIPPGCRVSVARHERPLRLVRLGGPGFIERLRGKLGLPA